MIRNLLQAPFPVPQSFRKQQRYSIKVFDAELDAVETKRDLPADWPEELVVRFLRDEGWFWGAGWRLRHVFFEDRDNDREDVRDWDIDDRPFHSGLDY